MLWLAKAFSSNSSPWIGKSLFSIFLLPVILSFTHTVMAADWKPELLALESAYRGPNDPIKVKILAPAETIQRLALELDGFDISQVISFDGTVVTYTPLQPLSFGEHRLRLIEYLLDGSQIERGNWLLVVRKSQAFSEAELQGNVWLDLSGRIAEKNLVTNSDDFNLGGGIQLQGAVADGNWRVTGTADMLYNNNQDLMPRGNEGSNADLGYFLLQAQTGPVVAQAGHFAATNDDNLIMQGFNRRGVSVGADWNEKNNKVIAFSQSTQNVVGFQGGLGASDANNRTSGFVVSSRPFSAWRDNLLLSATYVDGKGAVQSGINGTGIAGDPARVKGDAVGIVLDGNIMERRFRLRGEYANSNFDADGNGIDTNGDNIPDINEPAIKDKAYRIVLGYTPWHDMVVAGSPLLWNLGIEKKRVGSFFRTPTNQGTANDEDVTRLFTDVNWSGLFVYVSIGQKNDNLENSPIKPATTNDEQQFSITYSPPPPGGSTSPANAPALAWYGQPTFSITGSKNDIAVDRAAPGFSVGDFSETSSLSFIAAFVYPAWDWSLTHTLSEMIDKTNNTADSDTAFTQLAFNVRPSESLSLTTSIQYTHTEQTDAPIGLTAIDTELWTLGLGMNYQVVKDLNANVQLNYNDTTTSDKSQESNSRDLIASLAWRVRNAKGWTPGMTLSLQGQLHDIDESSSVTTNMLVQDSYQFFLKMSLGWSPHY